MISVTELRSGTVFEDQDQYFLVVSYDHIKMGRGTGTVKVKVKNLTTGSNVEKSFQTGARVNEASLMRKKVQYLYSERKSPALKPEIKRILKRGREKHGRKNVGIYSDAKVHIMDMQTFDQESIEKKMVEDVAKFLKEGMEITLAMVNDKPMFVEIPKIVDYKVTQTGGADRGNTVGASYKDAVLENGLSVKVPLFIKVGEIIRVDTRSGEYVERAK